MHTILFDHGGWGYVADRYPDGVQIHNHTRVDQHLVDGGDMTLLFIIDGTHRFDVEIPLHLQTWHRIEHQTRWRCVERGVVSDLVGTIGELVPGLHAAHRYHPDGDRLHLGGGTTASMLEQFDVDLQYILTTGAWESIAD